MRTFTVFRTKAKEVVEEHEKYNYNDAELPQFEGVEHLESARTPEETPTPKKMD